MEKNIFKIKNQQNYRMLILITVMCLIAGIYRNGIMTLFPFLQDEFNLNRTQVGFYSTFLYISSTSVTIFTGRIADFWGVKKSMLWGLLFTGLFIFLHSVSFNFISLLIFASITGIGFSIIMPTSSKGIAEWFIDNNKSTAMGIMTLGYPIGGVLGSLFLPYIGENFSWRVDVIIIGLLFLAGGLIFNKFYKSKEVNLKTKKEEGGSLLSNVGIFLKNKYLRMLCIIGVMFGIASSIVVTHFTLFLYTDLKFSAVIAGIGFMFIQIGSMIGRPFWGFLNDRHFGDVKRYGFLIVGLLLSITSASFFLLSNLKVSIYLIFFLAFLLGASGRGWQGLYFAAVSDQVGNSVTGLGIGLSLVFVRLGIIIGPPTFGFIADRYNSYYISWLILGIVFLIFIIISYFYLDKYNRSKKEII